MSAPSQIPSFRLPSWQGIAGLVHAFLGRAGGVSRGVYASLNMSFDVGDERMHVEDNRLRVRDRVAAGMELATMTQVHGATVATVAPGIPVGQADAMMTDRAGVALGVLTADCTPMLVVAPDAHAIAAVHAGWRGTLAGVAGAAVARLVEEYDARPSELQVALGPTIGACCYEVEVEIADAIEARWGPVPQAIRRYQRGGERKAVLDLRAINARLLLDKGVDPRNISKVGGCTCCEDDTYFSHRHATRSNPEARTGRQLSLVGWTS